MSDYKTQIYVTPLGKVVIPVNTDSGFSVLLQRLNEQFSAIEKTMAELRAYEIEVKISCEKGDRAMMGAIPHFV